MSLIAARQFTQLNHDETMAWIRLSRAENVGPITFYRLLEFYGSPQKALEALPELSRKGGRKKPLIAPPLSQIEREYAATQKLNGKIITAADPDFPIALSVLEDCPPTLTILGDASLLNRPCLGMVGARNASINGKKMAQKLAYQCGVAQDIFPGNLPQDRIVIVSGLARGIDAAAHLGALQSGTIAVLGGGADVIYPKENTKLYHDICAQGAIIAENPLGWQPRAQDFPRRNRIISGLSTGVVVVEANLRSGSLITARMAAEQGRDVLAVPGFPGDPRAQGPNSLIKDGAILVQNSDDILQIFQSPQLYSLEDHAPRDYDPGAMHDYHSQNRGALTDADRDQILQNLSHTPIAMDELIRQSDCHIAIIQEAILELELAGRITRHAGNRISLSEI